MGEEFLEGKKHWNQKAKSDLRRPKLTINDVCTRFEWDVTSLSAKCCFALLAVENFSALKGIYGV